MLNIQIIEHDLIKLIRCWTNFHQIRANDNKTFCIFYLRDGSFVHPKHICKLMAKK